MTTHVYAALIHHPVLDKQGTVVVTSVTNMDIHDIVRSSRTYGIKNYFIVNPLASQLRLMERIRKHWLEGYGSTYNENRRQAMELSIATETLDEALAMIQADEGRPPMILATSAQTKGRVVVSFDEARRIIGETDRPTLLLFGTGWGLTDEVLDRCEHLIEPIAGTAPDGFNHLSVRSAAAIIFDRLLGR